MLLPNLTFLGVEASRIAQSRYVFGRLQILCHPDRSPRDGTAFTNSTRWIVGLSEGGRLLGARSANGPGKSGPRKVARVTQPADLCGSLAQPRRSVTKNCVTCFRFDANRGTARARVAGLTFHVQSGKYKCSYVRIDGGLAGGGRLHPVSRIASKGQANAAAAPTSAAAWLSSSPPGEPAARRHGVSSELTTTRNPPGRLVLRSISPSRNSSVGQPSRHSMRQARAAVCS